MSFGFILIFGLVVAGLWYFLDWRETQRAAKGLPRHSGLRLIFAACALLTMLFAGGCGTLFFIGWIADGAKSGGYVSWEIIAVLSLPPLLVGALVWWLAMRRKTG